MHKTDAHVRRLLLISAVMIAAVVGSVTYVYVDFWPEKEVPAIVIGTAVALDILAFVYWMLSLPDQKSLAARMS